MPRGRADDRAAGYSWRSAIGVIGFIPWPIDSAGTAGPDSRSPLNMKEGVRRASREHLVRIDVARLRGAPDIVATQSFRGFAIRTAPKLGICRIMTGSLCFGSSTLASVRSTQALNGTDFGSRDIQVNEAAIGGNHGLASDGALPSGHGNPRVDM